MSKIQISQLNNTALEVLDTQETSKVVGGRRGDNNSRRTVNRNNSRINAPSNLVFIQAGKRNRADNVNNGAIINVNQQSDQDQG